MSGGVVENLNVFSVHLFGTDIALELGVHGANLGQSVQNSSILVEILHLELWKIVVQFTALLLEKVIGKVGCSIGSPGLSRYGGDEE